MSEFHPVTTLAGLAALDDDEVTRSWMTDMNTLRVLISAAFGVSVVGILVFGAVSCSERDAELRRECVQSGGSVIPSGPQFACVRGSVAK